jgi:hypothetical protein
MGTALKAPASLMVARALPALIPLYSPPQEMLFRLEPGPMYFLTPPNREFLLKVIP